jgi:uncharacterized repeat protein (TIGR02543 family)
MKRSIIILAGIVCALLISCNNIFHLIASFGEEESDTGEFIVKFDKNGGGTDADPQTRTAQAPAFTVMLPNIEPTWAGHLFTGWNTNEDGNGTEFTRNTQVKANITVYAQWLDLPPGSYVVTFNKNNTESDSQEASPQKKAVIPTQTTIDALPSEPPIRTGYYFTGWNTRENGSGTAFDATTTVTENIIVYAQWDPYKCVVTFEKNHDDADGFTADLPPITVTYPAINVGTLPTEPTRARYDFAEWNTQADGKGTVFTADTPVGILEGKTTLTVYAQWAEKTYKVKGKIILSDDSDTSGVEVLLYREGAIVARTPANADGTYTFDKVLSREGYTVQVSLRRYSAGFSSPFNVEWADKTIPDLTLTRLWVISGMVRDKDSGVPLSGARLELKEDGVHVEYAYTLSDGRYELDVESGEYTIIASCLSYVNQDANITVNADTEKNFDLQLITYKVSGTVTLVGGSGSVQGVNLQLEGDAIYTINPQANGSYIFPAVRMGNYWIYAMLDGYQGDSKALSVTSADVTGINLTLKKLWTVTFDSKGGSSVLDQDVPHSETAYRPTNPTRLGYDFDGWYREPGLTNVYDFSTPVTDNITLHAKWNQVATYTVTFNSDGGSAVPTQTVNSGGTATRPTDPTKTGNTFVDWYGEPGLTNVYDFGTAVTGNITLHAKWNASTPPTPTPITVTGTVKLDGDGGGLRQDVQVQLFTINVLTQELVPIGSPVKASSTGTFTITGVTATAFVIVASLDGYTSAVLPATSTTTFPVTLTLSPGINGTSQSIDLRQLLLQLNN